jgi:hypothetical protein
MIQVYRIDSNGYFIEPVVLDENEEVPSDCVGCNSTRWIIQGTIFKWSMGGRMSQKDIDAIKNTPEPLSELEQIKKQQADLTFTLMINGVI